MVLDALMPTAQHHVAKVGPPIEATAEWSAQPWTAVAPTREGAVLLRLGLVNLADLYRLWEPFRRPGSSIEPQLSVALGGVQAHTASASPLPLPRADVHLRATTFRTAAASSTTKQTPHEPSNERLRPAVDADRPTIYEAGKALSRI
ncbi:hypothetical protein ACQEWB_25225 [Streptomyces sp. CA-249302]|uniref:hypothetical protein n=1 Tax=Streptomyces sp. CA-249302 TaxID=3240058 RepID=UPI003D924D19